MSRDPPTRSPVTCLPASGIAGVYRGSPTSVPTTHKTVRSSASAEWPGPEQGYGDWFGRYPAVVREGVEADYPDAKPGAAPDPLGMLSPQ